MGSVVHFEQRGGHLEPFRCMKTKLPYVQILDFCFFASYTNSRPIFSFGIGLYVQMSAKNTFHQPYVTGCPSLLETKKPYVQHKGPER